MQSGIFYLVATPIGNLQDISKRAIETLKSCNFIACENINNSKKLLDYYNITAKLIPYNDHSKENQREKIINLLKAGNNVALITDGGTPLISDPGYKLTAEIAKQEMDFYAIPGACSLINALVCSCLPSNRFLFAGFLDGKASTLQELFNTKATIIIFESPKRVIKTLEDIRNELGDDINVCASREMTKIFEEHIRGSIKDVIKSLKSKTLLKGEFVIIVDNNKQVKENLSMFYNKVKKLLDFNVPVKEITNILASKDINKKELYNYILKVKNHSL